MTRLAELHDKWSKDPLYASEYAALADEFAIAQSLIAARLAAGLTQEQLAERMQTTQSVVARLESGKTLPSTRTLKRYAEATGTNLRISLETAKAS
jgi:transcriptional regulator with XRE-family HTH domain